MSPVANGYSNIMSCARHGRYTLKPQGHIYVALPLKGLINDDEVCIVVDASGPPVYVNVSVDRE